MKVLVLALLAAIGLSEVAALDIQQQRSSLANLIETSPTNYGIASSSFKALGWESITVNGNDVKITTPDCGVTVKSYDTLSGSEKSLVEEAKNQLSAQRDLIEDVQFLSVDPTRLGEGFNFGRGKLPNSMRAKSLQGFQFNGQRLTFNKADDDNYSITMRDMPVNLGRVFVNSGVVTFVKSDGQVLMQRISCLQSSEQQLLEHFKVEIQKVLEH